MLPPTWESLWKIILPSTWLICSEPKNVNSSFHQEITALRQVYDVLESGFEGVGATMKMMNQRLEALEIRDNLSASLIGAMETSVIVKEDTQGRTLSLEITDMDDIDHM